MSLLHKTKQQKRNNDPLIRLMTPMIAGILACVFCLVSMTWAWFTASVNTPTQTIQSANRSASVVVYEVSGPEEGNSSVKKTLVKPQTSKAVSLAEKSQTTDEEASEVVAGEAVVWELSPEKSYEVVMTGSGTASTGYCEVALSHTLSENNTPETKLYQTSNFEKDNTVKFTYNTGGFSKTEGVTQTQWKEYVKNTTPPTLKIESYWGKPAKEEEITPLSDGDVLGLSPIPCPEAKAETELVLIGFETQASAVISAEEDYKISLTPKEGYEMPSKVVVNIGGKDYVVSTGGAEASDDAPYYDAASGILTVPSALLSDGITVSVKATATLIPEEEPVEEETEEEATEEITEETTDNNEPQEDNSADTPLDNNIVADNPTKKEEDSEKDNDRPKKPSAGGGGNDDDNDDADNNSASSDGNSSSPDNNEEETEVEKADVTLNLSQLTINLEETQIPTNADLVLTLSAKEDKKLPEKIVITLDKTIRDEDVEDEEIEEDTTEYIINTDGKDNPEGFEFDAESGELTISSELLEGVREIAIADIEENEADEDEEKTTLTFEVKNLTFDFADDEIATDEDVMITFTAGEGYELPETIIITIDGKEYIVYTSDEESSKNPEGITFDAQTGTLTISKDLLEDVKAITIAAEGIKKEDEKSEEKEENTGEDKKEESEDKDTEGKENGAEGGDTTDKKPEGGTTTPETNPDNTTGGEDNGENDGEGKTETPESGTEPTTPTEPDVEDNTDSEQGTEGGNAETEENGKDSTEDGTGEAIQPAPDTESGDDSETPGEPSEPSPEPTTPTEPSEPVVTPETPKTETPDTSEPTTGGNDGNDNDGTTDTDSSSTENNSGSENASTESNASSGSTSSDSPSVTPTAPSTSAPTTSETSTPGASTQASGNTSSTPASSTPTPSANSSSNGAGQTSGSTTSSESKETSSEE